MLEWTTNLACWIIREIFWPFTSVKGWWMVELLPKVLWFRSYLRILISSCNFPSNSFFLVWFIDRSKNLFDLLSQLKYREWNCCPRYLNFNHNLPEFWYPDAIFPLIHCSYVLFGERMHTRSTGLACWSLEQIFWPLTLVKGWRTAAQGA